MSHNENLAHRLLTIAGGFAKLRTLVIGDIILDRYVWGKVERISPEAPVPIVSVQRNEDRLGGAGNAANNFSALGARTLLSGVTGADSEREAVFELLRSSNLNSTWVISDPERPTTLKTRVMGHKQQLLRIDRESVAPCQHLHNQLSRAVEEVLPEVDCVLVSDYGKGVLFPQLLTAIHNTTKGLGKRSPIIALDPHPANYSSYSGFSFAKPNRKECEAASGIKILGLEDALRAGQLLRTKWQCDYIIVSLSEDGVIVAGEKSSFHLPTIIRDVFDVSGAGDTITAVATLSLAAGASIEEACQLAIIAASNVVGKLGTSVITQQELCHDILQLSAEGKLVEPRYFDSPGNHPTISN